MQNSSEIKIQKERMLEANHNAIKEIIIKNLENIPLGTWQIIENVRGYYGDIIHFSDLIRKIPIELKPLEIINILENTFKFLVRVKEIDCGIFKKAFNGYVVDESKLNEFQALISSEDFLEINNALASLLNEYNIDFPLINTIKDGSPKQKVLNSNEHGISETFYKTANTLIDVFQTQTLINAHLTYDKAENIIYAYQRFNNSPNKDYASLCLKLGYYHLNGRQKHAEALKYFQLGIAQVRELFKDGCSDLPIHLNDMAGCYYELKDVKNALIYHEEALLLFGAFTKTTDETLRDAYKIEVARTLGFLAEIYNRFGDKLYVLENVKQAYTIAVKAFGNEHEYSIGLREYLDESGLFSEHKVKDYAPIIYRGVSDINTLNIKEALQLYTLNKIQYLASKGVWNNVYFFTFIRELGVKEYLDKLYMNEILSYELFSKENIKIAQMLSFHAINLGVMYSKEKNLHCTKEFIKAYPKLVGQICTQHPEYFVDKFIVAECIKDKTLQPVLDQNQINLEVLIANKEQDILLPAATLLEASNLALSEINIDEWILIGESSF